MERLHRIVCAKCKSTLNSKAGVPIGQEIACPKCKFKFKAARPEEEVVEDFDVVDDDELEVVEDDTPAPPKKTPTVAAKQSPKPKSKPAIEVEEDEEKPRSKKKPIDDDEEEDEKPKAKKKKARAEEDEDDKPKSKDRGRGDNRLRKKKDEEMEDEEDEESGAYGRLKRNIWVRVSVLTVLLATAGLLGYKLYLKRTKGSGDDEDAKMAARLETEQQNFVPKNANLPNFQPKFNPKANPKKGDAEPKLEIASVARPRTRFNAGFPSGKDDAKADATADKPGINKLFLSADGSRVAISNLASERKKIHVWDVAAEPKKLYELDGQVRAFSPDGKRLIRRHPSTTIIAVETGTSLGELKFGGEYVYFVSPDVVVEMNRSNDWSRPEKFLVRKCDAATGRELESFEASEDNRVSISAPINQNKELVFGMDPANKIKVYDLSTKSSLREFSLGTPDPNSMWFGFLASPDGKWIAVQPDVVESPKIRDGKTGVEFTDLPKRLQLSIRDDATAFLPNRNIIMGTSQIGRKSKDDFFIDIVAYDFVKKTVVAGFQGHEVGVLVFAVSADGKVMASGDMDGNVLIWNLDQIR
jgi:WD40 repeat protein